MVAPHLREEPLAAHDLAGVLDEVMEDAELPVREVGDELADSGLPSREVERQRSGVYEAVVVPRRAAPAMDADPRDELVEREGLRDVVARPEPEPAQLRLEVGAG